MSFNSVGCPSSCFAWPHLPVYIRLCLSGGLQRMRPHPGLMRTHSFHPSAPSFAWMHSCTPQEFRTQASCPALDLALSVCLLMWVSVSLSALWCESGYLCDKGFLPSICPTASLLRPAHSAEDIAETKMCRPAHLKFSHHARALSHKPPVPLCTCLPARLMLHGVRRHSRRLSSRRRCVCYPDHGRQHLLQVHG